MCGGCAGGVEGVWAKAGAPTSRNAAIHKAFGMATLPSGVRQTATLHLVEALRQFLEGQELALRLAQIVDADAVLGPARAHLFLERGRQRVDRRIAAVAPVGIALELPVPRRVDEHAGPLPGAVGLRVG